MDSGGVMLPWLIVANYGGSTRINPRLLVEALGFLVGGNYLGAVEREFWGAHLGKNERRSLPFILLSTFLIRIWMRLPFGDFIMVCVFPYFYYLQLIEGFRQFKLQVSMVKYNLLHLESIRYRWKSQCLKNKEPIHDFCLSLCSIVKLIS